LAEVGRGEKRGMRGMSFSFWVFLGFFQGFSVNSGKQGATDGT